MGAVILAELAVAGVAWLVFIGLLLAAPSWTSPTFRQLVAASLVAVGEFWSLFALGLGAPVPVWVFVVGFAAADVVVIRWIVLRLRARRAEGAARE